jgi:hypothetical protein
VVSPLYEKNPSIMYFFSSWLAVGGYLVAIGGKKEEEKV